MTSKKTLEKRITMAKDATHNLRKGINYAIDELNADNKSIVRRLIDNYEVMIRDILRGYKDE